MAVFVKIDDFQLALGKDEHDFSVDVLKLALSNVAPTAATDTAWLTGTHLPPTNVLGYTTGGNTLAGVTWTEAAGVSTLKANETVYTAAGGTIGPFRYAILYNSSATTPADAMIGYWDYASSITLADGETFTATFNNTAVAGEILTIT